MVNSSKAYYCVCFWWYIAAAVCCCWNLKETSTTSSCTAFIVSTTTVRRRSNHHAQDNNNDDTGSSGWSVTDDWNSLSSSSNNALSSFDTVEEMFQYGDAVTMAANSMENENNDYNNDNEKDGATATITQPGHQSKEESTESKANNEEDAWVNNMVDSINHNGFMFEPKPGDVSLYDTGFEDYTRSDDFSRDMSDEINMLVRCNENPNEMLVSEGRALPPLTNEEMNNVNQLIDNTEDDGAKPTKFFQESVTKMFNEHCVVENIKGEDVRVLDSTGVAKWMTKALGNSNKGPTGAAKKSSSAANHIGPHDKRVTKTISKYGTYGTGRIFQKDFMNLYMSVVTSSGATTNAKKPASTSTSTSYYSAATMNKKKPNSQRTLDNVFRDIRNHGILTPVEIERSRLAEEIRSKYQSDGSSSSQARLGDDSLYDECEILDWGDNIVQTSLASSSSSTTSTTTPSSIGGKSSHELVELCSSDNKTPKRLRDGDYIFIDEESCIGCNLCADISPSSFLMLPESGRARTYYQRNAIDVSEAVTACPARCMHRVSYDELTEMETVRDDDSNGSGAYSSKGHIPLHVAGMDSDTNRRSSFYHNIKQKCHMSKQCPQRGCFDCPLYNSPGDNPYWKAKHRKSEHMRATDFTNSGEADMWRKTADL